MMAQLQRFLIAPYESGLQDDKRAWLISNDAFEELRNAYLYRGRIRKKFGTRFLEEESDNPDLASRVRINIGTTDVNGDIDTVVPGNIFKIGQVFSIGDVYFSVYQTGAPASMLRSDNVNDTATYNTDNNDADAGRVVINGAPADTTVYFYPAEPIMGIFTYEQPPFNDEVTIVFDTQFAYQRSGVGWQRLGTAVWTGSTSDFFWGINYRALSAAATQFIVTNNTVTDGIRTWDGSNWTTRTLTYNNNGDTIDTARIILSFKDRLVLLNTVEGGTRFVNRCRYSVNGDPFGTNAWRQDIPGNGSFIDAPTKEAIITADFVQDRLVVYFERSTYELAYTQNQIIPFVWRKINSELGAESTYSVISLDDTAIAVGNVGIHQCNGAQVQRIDDKIPDEVFRIRNTDGVDRVHGIRDFQIEQLYWTIPKNPETTYPTQVLSYDYRQGAWARHDASITAFGYTYNLDARTWESDDEWQYRNDAWNYGTQLDQFLNVLAGNQQGYTFIVDPYHTRNAASLYVSDADDTGVNNTSEARVINHNLEVDDFVQVANGVEADGSGGTQSVPGDERIFRVLDVFDKDTIELEQQSGTDLAYTSNYLGGSTLRRVDRVQVRTKEFGFFLQQGYDSYVPQVDVYVDKTENGQLTFEYFSSSSDLPLSAIGRTTNTNQGTNTLDTFPYSLVPYEQEKTRLWHSIYPYAEGETVQFEFFFSDAEMFNPNTAFSDIQLHAMLFYASPSQRVL